MPRRRSDTRVNVPVLVAVASVTATAAACAFHLPFVVFVWAGVVGVGASLRPVILTGARGPDGAPSPANPSQARRHAAYTWMREATARIGLPRPAWVDLRYVSWWAAAGLALASAGLNDGGRIVYGGFELTGDSWWWTSPLSVVAIVMGAVSASRRVGHEDPRPGVRLRDLSRSSAAVGIATGSAAGLAAAWCVGKADLWVDRQWPWTIPVGLGLAAGAAAARRVVAARTLAPWRELLAARQRWRAAFAAVAGRVPSPRLVRHRLEDQLTIDTFDLAPGTDSAAIIALEPKLATFAPPGWQAFVVHAWAVDSGGSPLPGTASASKVHILTCPVGYTPDLTRCDIDDETAALFVSLMLARCVAAWMSGRVDVTKRMIPARPEPLHGSDSDAALWAVPVARATGGSNMGELAAFYGPQLERFADCDVVAAAPIDRLLVGSFSAQIDLHTQALADMAASIHQRQASEDTLRSFLQQMAQDAAWHRRWSSIRETAGIIPEAQWGLYRQGRLSNGVRMYRLPFVTLNGQPPESMLGLEKKLAATLQGSPFASLTRFHDPRGARGQGHSQGFVVSWAAPGRRPWASVAEVCPSPPAGASQGVRPEEWLLAGMVNEAFDAAKLTRPELVEAASLTDGRAQRHLWRLTIRLYGGVSVEAINKKASTIQASLSSPWLGVASGPGDAEATIYAGVRPSQAHIVNDEARRILSDIEWQQIFAAAKVVSPTGQTPTTVSVERLPFNDQVQRFVFELPAGLGISDVRARADRIASGSANLFLDVSPDPADGSRFVLLASQTDPLPRKIDYDFGFQDAHKDTVALGSGVDGAPIVWDPASDPHLMLIGLTGSGKALAADTLVATPGGPVSIEDLAEGDICVGAEGEEARVVSFSPWTDARLWRVTFADGTRVECDARHLWRVTDGETTTVTAADRQIANARQLLETSSGYVATGEAIARLIGCDKATVDSLPGTSVLALAPSHETGVVYCVDDVLDYLCQSEPMLGGYDMTSDHVRWLGLEGQWLDRNALAAALTPGGHDIAALLADAAPHTRIGQTKRLVRLYHVDEIADAYVKAARPGGSYVSRIVDTVELSQLHGACVVVDGRLVRVDEVAMTDDVGRVRCVRLDNASHMFRLAGGIPTHNSAAVQGVIYGCLSNGWDVAVGDAAKAGADFLPFADYLSAFAPQPQRAWQAAMLKAVYAEVRRRVELTVAHGVANIADVPEEVRPARLVVILDEFTSLINVAKPPPLAASASAEERAKHAAAVAERAAVTAIGHAVADIAAQARSAGVSLILVGQQIKAKDLEGLPGGAGVRTNMSRILLGKATDGDRMAALRQPGDAPALGAVVPRGRGIVEPASACAEIIQVWYVENPAKAYPAQLSARRSGKPRVLEYEVDEEAVDPVWEGKEIVPAPVEETMTMSLGDLLGEADAAGGVGGRES